MRRELEEEFRDEIRNAATFGLLPRDVIEVMLLAGKINHPKQAWRTLEKWAGRGEYDYGVSIDMGWLVVK